MRHGRDDPYVISAKDLAEVIINWLEQWEAERPYKHVPSWGGQNIFNGSFKAKEHKFFGSYQYLRHYSNVNIRQIYRILNGEQKWVTFETAERILMAIDREYMLVNGELSIVPNPLWTQEKWQNYMAERGCV